MKKSSKPSGTSARAKPVEIAPLPRSANASWLRMRAALWPAEDRESLGRELDALRARPDFAVIGARRGSTWIGFAEVGSRPYAEGCATSPVGFLEGIWVDASARRQGIGRRLVEAAIAWARARGYREFGSDTGIDNTVSQWVHLRLGFAEVERLVAFRKDISG
jgi:aminoglycoside 6'-N-acetyltransferase I